VRLASGELVDVTYVSDCGVQLRPLARVSRTVFDSKTGQEVTFTARRSGYTVASSAHCQGIVPAGIEL
jgi:hypothetical protein